MTQTFVGQGGDWYEQAILHAERKDQKKMKMPTPAQRIWLQYIATGERLVLMRSQNKISTSTKRACRENGWTVATNGETRITQKGIDALKEGTRRANAR